MNENKKLLIDKDTVDWEKDLHEKTNGRDHWSGDLMNVVRVGWPLLLYIGLVSGLLFYLWWREYM